MTEVLKNRYEPDAVSPPGETLEELLATRGMSQAELSERTGRPKKTINEIIQGKAAITPETAIQFERVLGVPASFWNARESQYRESLARRREAASLEAQTSWLSGFPYASMAKLRWVPKSHSPVERVANLLSFFAVASPSSWEDVWSGSATAFRRSHAFKTEPGAIAAWLRRGEIEGKAVAAVDYDSNRFKELLRELRVLTRKLEGDFRPELVRRFSAAGVVIVFVPELPGTRAWGATRWLTPTRPLMQVSLRYKFDDHFWFTVFHEAAHILLHGKRDLFIELEDAEEDAKEREADEFARDWLISRRDYDNFLRKPSRSCTAVRRFAYEIDVAPGIVVGRLQRDEELRPDQCNELKKRLDWFVLD